MALQSSGPISLNDIQNEFGGSNPISISEYYGADPDVPGSGTISLSDFYGAASFIPFAWDALLVGGGGGGGSVINNYAGIGGGGAAGRALLFNGFVTTSATWNISIGAGGSPAKANDIANSTGGTTSLTGTDSGDHSAAGGGYGGVAGDGVGVLKPPGHPPTNGGGGMYDFSRTRTESGAAGVNGAFSGGSTIVPPNCNGDPQPCTGGGGAGADENGYDGNAPGVTKAGTGGDGISNTFFDGTTDYYGGGGGGGGYFVCDDAFGGFVGGYGGRGGGGTAGGGSFLLGYGNNEIDGVDGFGGGGAGGASGRNESWIDGGRGGSGVVIIRVPNTVVAPKLVTGNPTITTYGSYRSYRFTSSGTITW